MPGRGFKCEDGARRVMIVLGRTREAGPTGLLGRYRARDGSQGSRVHVDLDGPHAAVVVGKRGSGKSYTLGVLAEGLARADGVSPIVVDPMGAFRTLAAAPVSARVVTPQVAAGAVPPRAWCGLLDLDPASGPGGLVWRAADECDGLAAMRAFVADADVTGATRRAAANHLRLAASWDVFDEAGFDAEGLVDGPVVLDCASLARAPANAVVAAVARSLYDARVADEIETLPWLLIDEAHAFLDGVAERALGRVLTRGRQPGVSLVAATQRPSALPEVAVSQSDLLVAHRLTDRADRDALAAARPAYVDGTLAERLPTDPGAAVVVDDATESVHALQVRERRTPHGGGEPRASAD